MWLLWALLPTLTVYLIWEGTLDYGKTNHLKEVCKSNNVRSDILHDLEQEATNDNQIDMVNINPISLIAKDQ